MKITPRFYKVYPELALFSSDEERKAVLKAFQRGLLRKPLFWVMCFGFGVINAAVMSIADHLPIPGVSNYIPPGMTAILPATAMGICWGLAFQYAWRRPTQRHLRRQLLVQGVPICLHCGYDLRGQTEPRCPECGRPFDQKLVAEPDRERPCPQITQTKQMGTEQKS